MTNKENRITKKMNFAEILKKYPESEEILLESGMHCVGCPMAMQETLEEGALAHGLNPDEIAKKISDKIGSKKNGKK